MRRRLMTGSPLIGVAVDCGGHRYQFVFLDSFGNGLVSGEGPSGSIKLILDGVVILEASDFGYNVSTTITLDTPVPTPAPSPAPTPAPTSLECSSCNQQLNLSYMVSSSDISASWSLSTVPPFCPGENDTVISDFQYFFTPDVLYERIVSERLCGNQK